MFFFIHTLGCKINQYESQAIREAWIARGWVEVSEATGADMVLAHTCAVTSGAVADSRGAVRRVGRVAPAARILVTGCAAQVDPNAFAALPGVEAVVMQRHKPGLLTWSHYDGPCPSSVWPQPGGPDSPTARPSLSRSAASNDWPGFAISGFDRARPILKIQDGCSHGCTYCIVPRARGAARSRPYPDILAEARRLLEAGHRELILSGVNLGQFVLSTGGGDFWDLLRLLDADLSPRWGGRARLRLSSLDPGLLGPKALATLTTGSGLGMVCPHLHLSMQSADPGVLAAMGRGHYHPRGVLGFLDALRGIWPLFALGADLLTGFPGESELAFRATLDFFRQAGLSYAHVFPYSRRPGTVAARAANQLPREVKKARAARLRQEATERETAFLEELARLPGLVMAVERERPGVGVSEYYMECRLEGASPVARKGLLPVRPLSVSGGAILAEAAHS
jgi:MiaB/RimO family radical SAM methylthiotransferase